MCGLESLTVILNRVKSGPHPSISAEELALPRCTLHWRHHEKSLPKFLNPLRVSTPPPPQTCYSVCLCCSVLALVPLCSGGKVELSSDGKFLACLYEWDVSFVDVEEGVVTKRLRSEGNPGGEEEIVRHRSQTRTHTHDAQT